MATHDEVYDILKPYATVLANPPENSTAWEIYFALLEDISPEALQAGIIDHVCQSRWFPKVSELRQQASVARSAKENPVPTIQDRWSHTMYQFNASLRGEISEDELYMDPQWQWFERRRSGGGRYE